jgi:hypothetical protein
LNFEDLAEKIKETQSAFTTKIFYKPKPKLLEPNIANLKKDSILRQS